MASGGVNDDENKLRKKLIECLIRLDVKIDGDFVYIYDEMQGEAELFDVRQLARDLVAEGVKP